MHHPKGMQERLQHGQFTVTAPNGGEEIVNVQRGKVTAVSPTSLTVASTDGFSATYKVDTSSKVERDNKAATIGDVRTGDQVFVAAVKSGTTDTAKHIIVSTR